MRTEEQFGFSVPSTRYELDKSAIEKYKAGYTCSETIGKIINAAYHPNLSNINSKKDSFEFSHINLNQNN